MTSARIFAWTSFASLASLHLALTAPVEDFNAQLAEATQGILAFATRDANLQTNTPRICGILARKVVHWLEDPTSAYPELGLKLGVAVAVAELKLDSSLPISMVEPAVSHQSSYPNGLVPWPRLGMECLFQRESASGSRSRRGLPCLEGGSVAVMPVTTQAGSFQALVMYARQHELVVPSDVPPNTNLESIIQRSIGACLPEIGTAVPAPVDLSSYACCISQGPLSRAMPYIPVRGVAVLPKRVHLVDIGGVKPVYSGYRAPHGELFSSLRGIEVTVGQSATGNYILELSILVYTPH